MAIHKPYDRHFVSTGAVKTEGGSLNLALGQLGVFKVNTKHNAQGLEALSNFKNLSKKEKVEIKVGNNTNVVSSTHPFEIGKIKGLRVSAPQKTEQTVDEVIIGYNGLDESTSITFGVGEFKEINLRLSGEKVGLLGYPEGFVNLTIPLDTKRCSYYAKDKCNGNCDECASVNPLPVLLAGFQRFLNTPLKGGVKVTDLIEYDLIKKCTGAATTLNKVEYKFYELSIVDSGTLEALSAVQSQYPKEKVVRKSRKGNTTTYEILRPSTGVTALAKFKRGADSFIKDCKECVAGWNPVEGGFLYTLQTEDENPNTNIEAIEGVKAGTIVKGGVTTEGLYSYTFVAEKELAKDKIDEYLDNNKDKSVVLTLVGKVSSVCKSDAVTEFAWTEKATCNAILQEYILDLPDTKCGADRLDELKAHYGTNEITKGITGGCQSRYHIKVLSNVLCDKECDPNTFFDVYKTEAPIPYEGRTWILKEELSYGTECKAGLRIRGKKFSIHPSENFRNQIAFTESSVGVEISGGWSNDIPELAFDHRSTPFHVEYVSRKAPRTHVGGNMWEFERMGRTYFTGREEHEDPITRFLLGEQSLLPADTQVVDYALLVEREIFSQGFSQKYNENTEFHILVPIGKHKEVEKLLNLLVSANGIEPVRALAE
jgi:hypothetical protein|nr:MAG TPA: hypothetical protein [Caudoviricetes sp.]